MKCPNCGTDTTDSESCTCGCGATVSDAAWERAQKVVGGVA
jgi:hypothetical protein